MVSGVAHIRECILDERMRFFTCHPEPNDTRGVNVDMQVEQLCLADISPNDYNPQHMTKHKMESLVNHINAVGFTDPIKVRRKHSESGDTADTPFIIVDGEHRLQAYQLAFPESKTIPCVVMSRYKETEMNRANAVLSSIAFNNQHGQPEDVRLSVALKIATDDGLFTPEIAEVTGMGQDELTQLLELQDAKAPVDLGTAGFGDTKPLEGDEAEPVILTFTVKKGQIATIEKAVKQLAKKLPIETDKAEVRGECLVEMANMVLGYDHLISGEGEKVD